jgi:hypothetical protein
MPWGIIGTLEAIFNKDIVTIFPRNPNLIAPVPLAIGGYPDHRLIYGATVQTRFINTLNSAFVPTAGGGQALNPTILDNATKGYYFLLQQNLKNFSTKVYLHQLLIQKQ